MTIILEGLTDASARYVKRFAVILAMCGYTVVTGCASNPSPAKTFQTWGHELAHVVCGRFHPTPGNDHTRAYKNVGSWDFSDCESGTYKVRVELYDDVTALQAALGNGSRANRWVGGWQTWEGDTAVIHVLRPTTNY